MRLSILIPCYNEQSTVVQVVRELLELSPQRVGLTGLEVIVCDDGSTDNSLRLLLAMAAEEPALKVVSHARNRGKSAAIRTALAEASGDLAMIHDADLEYSPSDCGALVAKAQQGALAVYGSRFIVTKRPRGMRPLNLVGNRALTWLANYLFDHRITDEATALKLFRTQTLRGLELTAEGFAFCPEVTAKLGLSGIRIEEVPVAYRARTLQAGKKVTPLDGVIAIALMLKLWVCWRPGVVPILPDGSTTQPPYR